MSDCRPVSRRAASSLPMRYEILSAMIDPNHEPPRDLNDPAELFAAYLTYYRTAAFRKLNGLTDAELRTSRLPSGWTPLELLKHLAYMERRWLRWGFAGEQVDAPWGDHGSADRWTVAPNETVDGIKAMMLAQAEHTEQIIASARLDQLGEVGGRFDENNRATLAWILFHVLQEYARHLGHLDVARELVDGDLGE